MGRAEETRKERKRYDRIWKGINKRFDSVKEIRSK
jgi:hypothetical protein